MWRTLFIFHYYNDILVLASSEPLCADFSSGLVGCLVGNGLVISPKSRLQPCQQILWLGKQFDLLHRVVRNTPALLGHLVALAVLSGPLLVHPKSALRLAGHA